MSGTQIPYQSLSQWGDLNELYRSGIESEVTPNITPEGRIGLDLSIENGSPTIINGATAVSKDSIKTNVVVDDGQTVVLGGVFKNTLGNDVTKILLRDLPYRSFFCAPQKAITSKNYWFLWPQIGEWHRSYQLIDHQQTFCSNKIVL